MESKMDIAISTFGESVVVKQLITSMSDALRYNLSECSEGKRITKKQIIQKPFLALLRKTIDTEDLMTALLDSKYLWGEMEFTDELRMCLVKMDIYSLNYLPDLLQDTKLREYVFSNSPRWLSYFGDLTEEEFIAFIKDNGCVSHVSNYKSLLLNNKKLMDTILVNNPELLFAFDFTKEQEFSYLSRSRHLREYKGTDFKVVEPHSPEVPHIVFLGPNTIYTGQVQMQADTGGQAVIYVERDVFINPRFSENGVPICVNTDVQKLTIKSEDGARLILSCPPYCIPIGIPTCTGLSDDRWSNNHGKCDLEEVILDNVSIIINSDTENLPLAGVYGESNTNIKITLMNGASVNGDQDYSQEGYDVRLPYVPGSTKLSSVAHYSNTKKVPNNGIQGF